MCECNVQGRLVTGGVSPSRDNPIASVYRINIDLTSEILIQDIGVSNGTCWSLDGKTMFFTDSRQVCGFQKSFFCVFVNDTSLRLRFLRLVNQRPSRIRSYNYDRRLHTPLTNEKTFVECDWCGPGCSPDGAIVDADGCLWSAEFGNGRVVRYNQSGEIDMIVRVNELYPTCCAFGGRNLDVLYITTAWARMADDQKRDLRMGALYGVRIPGVRGVKENRFGGPQRSDVISKM